MGEAEFGPEGLVFRGKLVDVQLLFGEDCPEAYVDEDVPVRGLHCLRDR